MHWSSLLAQLVILDHGSYARFARGKAVGVWSGKGPIPARFRTRGPRLPEATCWILWPPGTWASAGAAALVTTAIGYSARKPGDTLEKVDGLGNQNLVDAARRAKLGGFVCMSILTCDLARDVPHFWQKKLTEDYLEASGVPFVALRPGAFLSAWWWAKGLKKGRFSALGSPSSCLRTSTPTMRSVSCPCRRRTARGRQANFHLVLIGSASAK